MESEFKLLRQLNHRAHFARVTVDAKSTENGISIFENIREPIIEGDGEVNRKIGSHWIDAALKGAKECAEVLFSQGKIFGCRVEIKRVVGLIVDTDEEDIFCAGALATWQALNQNEELPLIHFSDSKWHIQF